MTSIDIMARSRIQRGVHHLHNLGPKATSEFLADVANRIGGLPAIVGLLEEYQQRALPSQTVRQTRRRRPSLRESSVTMSCVVRV